MATLAIGQGMTAHQGEISLSVDVFDIKYLKPFRSVALGAIGAQFALVNVLVARYTFGVDDGEIF